jgi:DNA-binding NarL/FixJ family response regulator
MTRSDCRRQPGDRPLEGLAVLIVEDAPAFRAALAAMARALGACVETADTAEQGDARLAAGGIDLAIVDIGLPDQPGGALLAAALERGERAAMLAVSAEHHAHEAEAADLFAPKPFTSLAAFRRSVAGALAVAAARRALAGSGGAAPLAQAAAAFARAATLGSPEAWAAAARELAAAGRAAGEPQMVAAAERLARHSDVADPDGHAAARLARCCGAAATATGRP